MRKKSVGGRRRSSTPSTTPSLSPIPLLSTPQDDHNATAFYSDSDGDDNPPAPAPQLDSFVPETEPVDLFDDNICITCNEGEGALLVCTESGCPVTVHVTCIGSKPKFDDSGNFYCPYCWYKRALNKTRQLREKATVAKKVLSSFLNESKTVRSNHVEEPLAQPLQDPVNRDDEIRVSDSEEGRKEHNDNVNDIDDKGKVSVTGSSVSETRDSDSEAISTVMKKKGHANAKRKVASSVKKKTLLQERNSDDGDGDDLDEEEVTSSKTLRLHNKQATKHTSLTGGKRKGLRWTTEEEKALKEGVLKFSKENQNIPWRKILEFGCRVFDKTRNPTDLKDKWKNITSKKGRK